MTALHGAYSIYHETLRLLWPSWRDNVAQIDLDAEVSHLGIEASDVGPLDLEQAIGLLRGRRDVLATHAAAALSLYHWAVSPTQQRRFEPTLQMRRNGELARDFVNELLYNTQRSVRELESCQSIGQAFLFPLTAQGCPVRDFWVRVNVGVGTNEATAAAGVVVDRTVPELTQRLDPQGWTTSVPELFEDTYRTLASPIDPEQAPARDQSPTPAWSGHLFETASWPLPPALRIRVRNILEIEFDPGRPTRQLKYSLGECLTGALTSAAPGSAESDLFRDYGGVDCDSGFVDARPTAPGSPTSSLCGLKCIRFCNHLSFLNPFTPGYLFFWMSFLILGGACYELHPELRAGEPG